MKSLRRLKICLLLALFFGVGQLTIEQVARAQEVVEGQYRFATERYFVATATFTPYSNLDPAMDVRMGLGTRLVPADAPWDDPIRLIGFLVEGHTPNYHMVHFGMCANSGMCSMNSCPGHELAVEYFTLGFEPGFEPEEGPGIDFVLFDTGSYAGAVAQDYFVQVRTATGTWSPLLTVPASTTRRYIREIEIPYADGSGIRNRYGLTAIEMDFASVGLPYGTTYHEIRLVSGCPLTSLPEYDIVMGAAVDRACTADAECAAEDACLEGQCLGGRCRYGARPPGSPCPTGVCDGLGQPSCVACVDDTSCEGATPRCDTSSFSCVGCVEDADCPGGRCAPSTQTCVACLEGSDCPADPTEPCRAPACSASHSCVPGPARPDGTACFADGYCHAERVRCVECRSDDHCTDAASPRCYAAEGACVACLEDEDCPVGDDPCVTSVCALDHSCRRSTVPGCAPDGGVAEVGVRDGGGPTFPVDAGTSEGAGSPDAQDEGCGCRAASAGSNSATPGVLFLLGLGLLARRRHGGGRTGR